MTLRRSIILALLCLFLIPIGVGAEKSGLSWHPAGYGGGGRFTNIAVDPSNPQTMYVGSDVAGVFRSRDGGNHFELVGNGLEGFAVADIAVNPASPHQVVVLADDGLYYSVNQGDAWIRISGEIRYPSRFFGSRLLLFTRNSLWIGTDEKGVFKIPLDNFKATPQPVQGLEFKVNGLAVYDGYLYAGTSRGVYRMEGQTWKSQPKGLLQGPAEITDIASARNSLYLVEKQSGLFRWDEKSGAWVNRPVPLQPQPKGYKSLLVHPDNPELVFIGSHPENWPHLLYKTQDGGATWKSIQSFQTDPEAPSNWTNTISGIEEMAFIPGAPQTIFMSDWWNIWKTSDRGEHWVQKHYGLQNTVINDLKAHPRNSQILYLCAADNGLMISEDSGKHWKRAMNGVADGHAQEIEISQNDPSRMVLLMNPWGKKGKIYLYESRDAGLHWKDIGFAVPSEALPKLGYVDGLATNVELDPLSEGTIYVGTNGYGVYKTVDAGRSWTPMNQGLATPYIKGPGALRIHPRSPNTLFVSTQAGGIYKSTNGASSWQHVTKGERFTFGMAIDPVRPSHIMAGGSGNKILVSNDEGKNWQAVSLPVSDSPQMAVNSIAFHPERRGLILAGTMRYDVRATEGIFISKDSGKTFRQVQMDLPKININAITMTAGQPVAAYVGFMGSGIFRVDLGETP
ncbi:MAG: YCF48-related protein [Syntrophales bacterium LBB04]|nr:YCF48-related protein [Syntrophales bacterium LBB04]